MDLRNKLKEAGLEFPVPASYTTDEALPDGAHYADGKLLVSNQEPEAKLRASIFAIALDVYRRFTPDQQTCWTNALFSPCSEAISEIQSALDSDDVASFGDVVEKLDTPVDRMVAIHLFNALIKSGTSFEDARGIDLLTWGGTSPLATGDVQCSLLPLLGAYAPSALYYFFPNAVVALVMDKLADISHEQVQAHFADIVKRVFNNECVPVPTA
jgi:hypothetical protein